MAIVLKGTPEYFFRASPQWSIGALPSEFKDRLQLWEVSDVHRDGGHFAEDSLILGQMDAIVDILSRSVSSDHRLVLWVEGAYLEGELLPCIAAVCGRHDSPKFHVPSTAKDEICSCYSSSWFSFVYDRMSIGQLMRCGANWNDLYILGMAMRESVVDKYRCCDVGSLAISELIADTQMFFQTTRHVAELEILGVGSSAANAAQKIGELLGAASTG